MSTTISIDRVPVGLWPTGTRLFSRPVDITAGARGGEYDLQMERGNLAMFWSQPVRAVEPKSWPNQLLDQTADRIQRSG